MSFLAPMVLMALGALAIPVLIHLIQRERKRIVAFPSLMFLRRIPYQSVRRRRIRHWMLLLLRLAALFLIVAAFARPFLRRPRLVAAGRSGAREVVILLDHSYSMGYGDRWARAQRAARQAVDALARDDRATLITFSTSAEAGVRSATDRGPLRAAIDAAQPSAGGTRYGPALKLAQSVLAESMLPGREVILVSDFQSVAWKREDGVRLPEGALLTPVPVSDAKTANVVLSAATFHRGTFSGQERVTVSAGLTNRGAGPIENLEVALEIDGRTIQSQRVDLEPNGSASLAFAPFTLSAPFSRGTVRAAGDALAADNAFHFVLSPGRSVPVLIVERASATREASLYLSRALAIGDAPAFRTDVKRIDRLAASDLDATAERAAPSVVILNDVPLPSVTTVQRLHRLLEGGGGLLVVLGEHSTWPTDGPDLFPGQLGPAIDRASGRGGSLVVDFSHPVFELFKAPRSGDFSTARFFRYREVTIAPSPAPAGGVTVKNVITVPARFDDGAVAMAERPIGAGRVMVWASTLDSFWNDLALKPVFLPFVHRVTRYLAGYEEPAPWFTVGQVLDANAELRATGMKRAAAAAGLRPDEGAMSLTPSGRRVRLAGGDRAGVLELTEQGFYEVRSQGTEQSRPMTVAVNADRAESDLTPLDPQELVAAVAGRPGAEPAGDASEDLSPAAQEQRQGVWWYLLLAGILMLAFETVLSNRLSRSEVSVL